MIRSSASFQAPRSCMALHFSMSAPFLAFAARLSSFFASGEACASSRRQQMLMGCEASRCSSQASSSSGSSCSASACPCCSSTEQSLAKAWSYHSTLYTCNMHIIPSTYIYNYIQNSIVYMIYIYMSHFYGLSSCLMPLKGASAWPRWPPWVAPGWPPGSAAAASPAASRRRSPGRLDRRAARRSPLAAATLCALSS